MEDLVSIIIPAYNCEKYIDETIDSVENQTYKNWELIIIDDCSKDNTNLVINKRANKNNKITILKNEKNMRVAITRNNGIKIAKGRYICFLDADDKWETMKLEKQVNFIKEKECAFSYTGYEFADENCIPNGKKVYIQSSITYKEMLKKFTVSTITVMYDMNILKKDDIYFPNIECEDIGAWLNVLKKVKVAYGLNEILSYYRRTEGTLSSNKVNSAKSVWKLYRKVEKLNFFYSLYNFIGYAINAVKRRI